MPALVRSPITLPLPASLRSSPHASSSKPTPCFNSRGCRSQTAASSFFAAPKVDETGCPIHRVLCNGLESIHFEPVLCSVDLPFCLLLKNKFNPFYKKKKKAKTPHFS